MRPVLNFQELLSLDVWIQADHDFWAKKKFQIRLKGCRFNLESFYIYEKDL
jgi:hypothetical protein